VLHSEYGIVVYPTALTEEIDVPGLGIEVTFTEAYCGHIGKCNLAPVVREGISANTQKSCLEDAMANIRRLVRSTYYKNRRPFTRKTYRTRSYRISIANIYIE
jgi:hypothetical protein